MNTQHQIGGSSEPTRSDSAEDRAIVEDDAVLYEDQVTPEYGYLGFTLRELLIVGVWLIAFVVSFFPLGWSPTIWSQGVTWLLPVGVPTVAVFLIVLRRFSPDGIRRVGSLGIDQFASVAFSVSAVWWAQQLWEYLTAVVLIGSSPVVWVPWVELAASLALVVLSVFAFLIPGLREDFHGRLETLAHRNANPVRPVIARPSTAIVTPEREEDLPVPEPSLDVELSGAHTTDEIARFDLAGQVPLSAHASGGDTGAVPTSDEEDQAPAYARRSRRQDEDDVIDDDVEAILDLGAEPAAVKDIDPGADADRLPVAEVTTTAQPFDVDATNPRFPTPAQPFWALAPTERDIVDEAGELIFTIGPSAWALVIEDRGGAFVVRHDDGRIGYLHDIDDITKG